LRLYYDEHGIVRVASTGPIITNLYRCVEVDAAKIAGNPVGRRVVFGDRSARGGMRLAVVCNWGDDCGIATYTRYLVDALTPLVSDVAIFAEEGDHLGQGEGVVRCWRRGGSMAGAIRRVIDWGPTMVLIQHEFGIFPRAPYLLQMLQMLDAASLPYAVTLHSVYEHLDKVVCSSAMRNIVVHTQEGRDCLERLGHTSNVEVIPHGCVKYDDVKENWNITQTPHAIVQFGFGFRYKGVETALEAIARLKRDQPSKYSGDTNVHYCYLCSESPHLRHTIDDYYRTLLKKIEELGLVDNAVIIRGFQTEDVLNQYLRTYKVAVFPYVQDPKNVVYGASGAARIAMANRIPTIVSSSHMFDDLENVLVRTNGADQLAHTIDRVFSSESYRKRLVGYADEYVEANSWRVAAGRYLDFFRRIVDEGPGCPIVICGGG
jgi:glycosyltransferase involved in cell wall biosynthesis